MDLMILLSTTMTFLTPYITTAGEEFSKQIGKDLWGWLKGKIGTILPNNPSIQDQEYIMKILKEELDNNYSLAKELLLKLDQLQKSYPSLCDQTVMNNADVGKQVNLKDNYGTINL
ncbi:hypothetical protein [Segatella paludivivens]|uniref:hypothetical protein n=1 Tax=Segatella paludivivens TaxID=185294 RepID=UPI00036D8AC4|nr:hypothetical protein [Segatella paludivivens]